MSRAWAFTIGGVLGVAAAIAIAVVALGPRCIAVSGDRSISIPMAQLARGAVSFFCYHDHAGERLRFILARDADGAVHSALDTCRQCGSFHQGYTASKGELICRLCGNKYQISEIERGRASCVPIGLAHRLHNGVIEIKVADLERSGQPF